jgi:flagellar biosynthetic protein FlhB
MADDNYPERTEKATPKRRREAREKGQVARSRDLSGALVLLSGLLGMVLWGPGMWRKTLAILQTSLEHWRPGSISPEQLTLLFKGLALSLAGVLAPFLLTISGAALAGNYLQVGKIFSGAAITPDLSRVQLFPGLRRLFSLGSLVELAKSLAKILLVGLAAYLSLKGELPRLLSLGQMDPALLPNYLGAVSLRVAASVISVLLALGGLDYLYQRHRYEKGLRMSKQEVKDELRQIEGDPQFKARVRSLMRRMAAQRKLAEVQGLTHRLRPGSEP